MQNNRSGEDLRQITEGSRTSGQSGQHQEGQGSYHNHHLGLHSHRGVTTATSSINQATSAGQGGGLTADAQLSNQNGYQPGKRNSVAACTASSLAVTSGPGSRGAPGRQECHQVKSNPVKNPGSLHSMAQNENINISNFQQNLRDLVGGDMLDGSQTQQISAQLYQDMQNQVNGEPRNREVLQNANAIQQHLAGAPEGRASNSLQNYYQNQQAAAAGGRQLHQSKTHRASFGTSAISKNQSRYSNLQNYGYQQRIERIGSQENEAAQARHANEQAARSRQANEAQVIANPHYQVQYHRPQYADSFQPHHVKNVQISGPKESMITQEEVNPALDPREPREGADPEPQEYRAASQTRADSSGAAPGAASQGLGGGALHSSGGSIGSHSYKTASGLSGPGGMYRSKTQGRLTGSALQAKQSILSRIVCQQCTAVDDSAPQRALIKAYKGEKQPIIHNSDHSVNCGHCGQFYALKDQSYTHISNSGRKQFQSQAKIVKTVREQGTVFKLDEPISEIFRRMREMSTKVLSELKPHPYYLTKRVKRIDDLSYIAECLQSDNQTIHHAVHLMDLYSSKMNGVRDYDTLLISLVCLLISTKYLQIKYPGADTLNDMVNRRYNADLIITMEGRVLDTIDWQLMVFPIYDYVKLFISQGCLFENEDILKETTQQSPQPQDHPDETRTNKQKGRPNVQLAEHFKKYAEFFTDFCLYQECFMTVDPYLLACAIVAYARKYMGVAIIWPQELELLTQRQFQHFRDMYTIIENKYTENFPDHAKSQNYKDQILTEPIQAIAAQPSIRKNQTNHLQLSSDNKTQKTQNSSKKQGASFNTNANNLLDLKTPDKCVFDFNSVISGNKNHTQDKFSYEKFQINSNSIEKFRANKKTTQQIQKNLVDISASQTKGQTSMVFSDNKRQNANSHSFKKIIVKNQLGNNLSEDKKGKTGNNASQHQAVIKQPIAINNYLHLPQSQKRAQALKNSYQMANQENYSSQKSQTSQPNTFLANAASSINHTQMSMMNNMVNSPSANINENEQEVPPFKPMIIKSNSQAIGGGYECKTTTKKSPKGIDLEKINTLKEAMNSVNITAKLPSSTTNQSSSTIKLKINSSLSNNNTHFNFNKDGPATNKSYNVLGAGSNNFGVGYGPIKINQKVKLNVNSSRKKNQVKGGDSTAKKSKKSQCKDGSSSSQKMIQSKSYVSKMHENEKNNHQSTLNASYQQKMAEQRSKNTSQQQQQPGTIVQSRRGSQATTQQSQQSHTLAQQRNTSCVSHNQSRPIPQDKQQTYISGKPKNNYTSYLYSNYNPQQPAQHKGQPSYGCTGSSQLNANSQGRSALSLKNAHQVIKRKNSFQHGNTQEAKQVVNANKNISDATTSQGTNGPLLQPAVITSQVNTGKNLPNSLLRRATGGAQGRQTSLGAVSHYKSSASNNGMNNNAQSNGADNISHEEAYMDMGSQGSDGKSGLPKNSSLDELNSNSKNATSNEKMQASSVNPPAIMFTGGNMPKNKSFSNGVTVGAANNTSTLTATKATLVKMIQENRGAGNQANQTQQYMSEQPNIVFQRRGKHTVTHLHPQIIANQASSQQVTSRNYQDGVPEPQSLSLERAQQLAGQNQAQVQQLFDGGKPIQKMIKSGSQVLGKCRSRLNISRKEMLKQLNEKKEKMSQLVEAAHATRPTSNERSSTKKPNQSELINNFNQSQFEIHQLFQQKHPNQQPHHQRVNYQNGSIVSGFENIAQYGSYSGERAPYPKHSGNSGNANNAISQFITQAPANQENQNIISNQINIQNLRPSYSGQQHEMKSQAYQEQPSQVEQNSEQNITQGSRQQNYNEQQHQQLQQQQQQNTRNGMQSNNIHEIHNNQQIIHQQNDYEQY